MSKSGSSSKSGSPRAMPVETIITRFKSAQQKRRLREMDRSMSKITELLKNPVKPRNKNPKNPAKKTQTKPSPKTEVQETDGDEKVKNFENVDSVLDEEYYPLKLKRHIVLNKIQLKPKHDLKIIAQTNKRKRSVPQKGLFAEDNYPETSMNSSPLRDHSPESKRLKLTNAMGLDMSMDEMIQLIEDSGSLDDEDLLEILTCPSPVWWEDPPNGYKEDALFTRPRSTAEMYPSIRSQLQDDLTERKRSHTPNVLSRRVNKRVSKIVKTEENTDRTISDINIDCSITDEKFIKKRSKLESVLGNLRNRTSEANVEPTSDYAVNHVSVIKNISNHTLQDSVSDLCVDLDADMNVGANLSVGTEASEPDEEHLNDFSFQEDHYLNVLENTVIPTQDGDSEDGAQNVTVYTPDDTGTVYIPMQDKAVDTSEDTLSTDVQDLDTIYIPIQGNESINVTHDSTEIQTPDINSIYIQTEDKNSVDMTRGIDPTDIQTDSVYSVYIPIQDNDATGEPENFDSTNTQTDSIYIPTQDTSSIDMTQEIHPTDIQTQNVYSMYIPAQNIDPVELQAQDINSIYIPTQDTNAIEMTQVIDSTDIETQNMNSVYVPTEDNDTIHVPHVNSSDIQIPDKNSIYIATQGKNLIYLPIQNKKPVDVDRQIGSTDTHAQNIDSSNIQIEDINSIYIPTQKKSSIDITQNIDSTDTHTPNIGPIYIPTQGKNLIYLSTQNKNLIDTSQNIDSTDTQKKNIDSTDTQTLDINSLYIPTQSKNTVDITQKTDSTDKHTHFINFLIIPTKDRNSINVTPNINATDTPKVDINSIYIPTQAKNTIGMLQHVNTTDIQIPDINSIYIPTQNNVTHNLGATDSVPTQNVGTMFIPKQNKEPINNPTQGNDSTTQLGNEDVRTTHGVNSNDKFVYNPVFEDISDISNDSTESYKGNPMNNFAMPHAVGANRPFDMAYGKKSSVIEDYLEMKLVEDEGNVFDKKPTEYSKNEFIPPLHDPKYDIQTDISKSVIKFRNSDNSSIHVVKIEGIVPRELPPLRNSDKGKNSGGVPKNPPPLKRNPGVIKTNLETTIPFDTIESLNSLIQDNLDSISDTNVCFLNDDDGDSYVDKGSDSKESPGVIKSNSNQNASCTGKCPPNDFPANDFNFTGDGQKNKLNFPVSALNFTENIDFCKNFDFIHNSEAYKNDYNDLDVQSLTITKLSPVNTKRKETHTVTTDRNNKKTTNSSKVYHCNNKHCKKHNNVGTDKSKLYTKVYTNQAKNKNDNIKYNRTDNTHNKTMNSTYNTNGDDTQSKINRIIQREKEKHRNEQADSVTVYKIVPDESESKEGKKNNFVSPAPIVDKKKTESKPVSGPKILNFVQKDENKEKSDPNKDQMLFYFKKCKNLYWQPTADKKLNKNLNDKNGLLNVKKDSEVDTTNGVTDDKIDNSNISINTTHKKDYSCKSKKTKNAKSNINVDGTNDKVKKSIIVSNSKQIRYCMKCSSIFDTAKCNYCYRRNGENKNLNTTNYLLKMEPNFVCNICKYKAPDKDSLEKHILNCEIKKR